MSASSLVAPTYAMNDDEQGISAPRVRYAEVPPQLTSDIIQEISQYGSFLTVENEYELRNPAQLDLFAGYLNADSYYSFSRGQYSSGPLNNQHSYMDYNGLLNYYIQESSTSRYPNPTYDPARPEETGPEWIDEPCSIELSRLIFKKRDHAPVKPLAVAPKVEEQEIVSGATSSVQAPISSDSSSEGDARAMIIRSLTETYKSDPEALGKALAAFLANLK